MNTYDTALTRGLKQRVTTVRTEHAETVAKGLPQTFEQYRFEAGYIRALDHVADWIEEIEKQTSGETR